MIYGNLFNICRQRQAPGPSGHWLYGSVDEFKSDPAGFFASLHNRYGDIVKFSLGGAKAFLVTNADAIDDVLLGSHSQFQKNQSFWGHFKDLYGNGLLTNEGADWKKQRKLLAPSFHPNPVKQSVDYTVSYTKSLIDSWSIGSRRSMHNDMRALTAQIAARSFFHAPMEDSERVLDAVEQIEQQMNVRMFRPFHFLDYIPNRNNRIYWKSVETVNSEIERFIRNWKEGEADSDSLLSMLLSSRYDDGSRMSLQQIRDELINAFLAAHDTTAITLSWTFYLLSMNPEVNSKMKSELASVLCGKDLNSNDLESLVYTEQVIKESMRIYPAAYFIGREAINDIEVGGYHIPKGSTIFMAPIVTQRLSRYFNEPMKFIPERWDKLNENRLKNIYMPFGGGPRICIGKHMSLVQIKTILATIYSKFDLEYAGSPDPDYFATITLVPKDHMPMKVV